MTHDDAGLLVFKRQYMLQVLDGMNTKTISILQLCERFRVWFLGLWTMTVMLSVTGLVAKAAVIKVLAAEIALFYIFEVYYRRLYHEYVRRYNFASNMILGMNEAVLEKWSRPLESSIPGAAVTLRLKQFFHSAVNPPLLLFYLFFVILLVIYRLVF